MTKLTPANKQKLTLKAVALSELLLHTLDELKVHKDAPMQQALGKLPIFLEDIVETAYGFKSIRSSNKFQVLINKVDTAIRKNMYRSDEL